jgi:hypothetical protein
MDFLKAMFQEVRNIVRCEGSLKDRLHRAAIFAREHPTLFKDTALWDQVEHHDFSPAFNEMTGWAREGLANLFPNKSWEFVLAALGDCPELFHLCPSGAQSPETEQKFRDILLAKGTINFTEIAHCCQPQWLWGNAHNAIELFDDLLSTGGRATPRYHGNNGYFLWLIVGSLALIAPMSDVEKCNEVLQGRDRVYFLSGFGNFFTYLATVTPEGIRYEA